MGVQNYRAAVASAYPGKGWKERVQYMPDNQIIAIYKTFMAKGKFDTIRTPKRSDEGFRQMTIFDFGISRNGG